MANSGMRAEKHNARVRWREKIRREQRESQKLKVVKYNEIEREKTNVSPRGLTLSFLYGKE